MAKLDAGLTERAAPLAAAPTEDTSLNHFLSMATVLADSADKSDSKAAVTRSIDMLEKGRELQHQVILVCRLL